MFEMPIRAHAGLPQFEEREFDFSRGDDEAVDAMIAWLGQGERSALISCGDASRVACMPVETYKRFDDFALRRGYMPHWELRGFSVEDMPTIQDLLWAADGTLLKEALRELIESAPSPSDKPDFAKALSHVLSMVEILKDFEADPCDDDPRVTVPFAFCRCDPATGNASIEMQVRTYPVSEIGKWNPKPETSSTRYWWSRALGFKAWFGGVSIRESYRALAWLVCTLSRDSFVDYGIWFGDLPDDKGDERVQELFEGLLADFRDRMGDLSERTVPIEELATVSVDIEEGILNDFEQRCRESGLSVQNALHIALLRLIDDPEGFTKEVKLAKAG